MAIYAVGDVQGCYGAFLALLKQFNFDTHVDEIWFAGDLVNRGPASLEVLRWAMAHEAKLVLGNHDVHLLALAAGEAPRPGDTLSSVLEASDAGEIIDWLRRQPLMLREADHTMVHAGVHPSWSTDDMEAWASRLTALLSAEDWCQSIRRLYRGSDAESQALSCFTRIRMCRENGDPDYKYKGSPEAAPEGLSPWFELSGLASSERFLFGHWAALGHRKIDQAVSLDGGCVWGGELVAYRLEDGHSFCQPAV